ncbi:MAG: PAS domain S-box protein [Actinobacteria bacterium]|nr:PAS domain S-box protein [Actinomycetota bacterium]
MSPHDSTRHAACAPAPHARPAPPAGGLCAGDVVANLADHVAELIVVFDGNGEVIAVNDAIGRLLDRRPEEWIGRHGAEICHPDDLRLGMELLVSSQATGDGVKEPVTYRLSHADGTWIDAECISSNVALADGDQVLVLSCRPTGRARPCEAIFEEAAGRVSAMFEQSTLGMAQVGTDGRVLRANVELARLCGMPPRKLHGLALHELIAEKDRNRVLGAGSPLLQGRGGEVRRVTLSSPRVPDGREVVVRLSSSLVEDHHGNPMYFALQVVDLSDTVAAERMIRDREAQMRTILEMAEEGIVALDRDAIVLYANPRFAELVHLSVAELIGEPVERILTGVPTWDRPDTTTRCEHLLRRHDGTAVWVRISHRRGIWSEIADTVEHVLMVTDVSDLKAAEAELLHRSTHDPLTGLANRGLLESWIDEHHDGPRTALVYIDLDGFKDVNDTFGHAVGDQMLTVVASRLSSGSRQEDLVARLGGDEFVVACADIDPDHATALASRLVELIGEPVVIGDRIHVVGASAGLATGGSFSGHLGLLQRADAALYRAKADGGLGVVVDRDPRAIGPEKRSTSIERATGDDRATIR